MSEKRLVRRSEDRMLFGVAGGVADYLNVEIGNLVLKKQDR